MGAIDPSPRYSPQSESRARKRLVGRRCRSNTNVRVSPALEKFRGFAVESAFSPFYRETSLRAATYRETRSVFRERRKSARRPIATRQLSRPIVEFPAFGCDCEQVEASDARGTVAGWEVNRWWCRYTGSVLRAICRSFPYSFPRTGSRRRICAFHWVSECRLGPMAWRNADCRRGCVVFQRGRLRPASRVRTRSRGVVVTRRERGWIGEGRINPGGKRRRISQRDLSPRAPLSVCPFSFLRQRPRERERGISPSLYTGARSYVHPRAYIRGFELCSYTPERGTSGIERQGESERGKRGAGRTRAEEVEGRLASIRERDADRVGESWVRSHKEVDTRRHLNPPRPPSLPPACVPFRPPAHPTRRRWCPPRHPLTVFLPRTSDRPPSPSSTLSRCFALSRSPCTRCILLLFLPFCRPPSLFSLFWRSLRASLPSLAKPTPEAEARS